MRFAALRSAAVCRTRKKAQTFHGKYNLVLSVTIILYVFARIYTTQNGKQQGGWVNKSSLPNKNIFKFYNATPYLYICNNFFLGPMRQ